MEISEISLSMNWPFNVGRKSMSAVSLRTLVVIVLIALTMFSSSSDALIWKGSSLFKANQWSSISSKRLYAVEKNKAPLGLVRPEFSRVINVAQINSHAPATCRLLASETERSGLAERFSIPKLLYFAANVTLTRKDESTILVIGQYEAHVKSTDVMDVEVLVNTFDSLLLNSFDGGNGGSSIGGVSQARGGKHGRGGGSGSENNAKALSFAEATDYDDEVSPTGNIDIGEIAAQYFALEYF